MKIGEDKSSSLPFPHALLRHLTCHLTSPNPLTCQLLRVLHISSVLSKLAPAMLMPEVLGSLSLKVNLDCRKNILTGVSQAGLLSVIFGSQLLCFSAGGPSVL